jgi:hypothetical protein
VQKYHEYNVDVVRKDGLLLVRELAAEVKNHMDFKINAVMVSRPFITTIRVVRSSENLKIEDSRSFF